jgi:hypothetical protein
LTTSSTSFDSGVGSKIAEVSVHLLKSLTFWVKHQKWVDRDIDDITMTTFDESKLLSTKGT